MIKKVALNDVSQGLQLYRGIFQREIFFIDMIFFLIFLSGCCKNFFLKDKNTNLKVEGQHIPLRGNSVCILLTSSKVLGVF